MPIVANCTGCGKSLKVRDELIGKSIKCPSCGTSFKVTSSKATAAQPAPGQRPGVSAPGHQAGRFAGIHLSPLYVAILATIAGVAALLLFWNLGPGAVRQRWAELEPKASQDVSDVIDHVLRIRQLEFTADLQATLHGTGKLPQMSVPANVDNVTFLFGELAVTFPQEVGFSGTTSGGMFTGTYNTTTHQVIADVDVGGLTLPSGVMVRRGNRKLHITGQVQDGKIIAELDGKPVVEPAPATRPTQLPAEKSAEEPAEKPK